MEPKVLKLKHPITLGSETITELEFRGPLKGKHVKGIPLGNAMCMEHILMVGGRLCAQPPSVMAELEGEDLFAVMGITSGFLPGGPSIGGASSE